MKNNLNIESRLHKFADNPQKALWTLTVPVMFGMLVMTIYSLADMYFVGKFDSIYNFEGNAIAAVAFVMPLFFFVIGITYGIGSGVTAVIARFIGEENKKGADNAAEHAIFLGVVLGSLFTVCGLLFGSNLLKILGAADQVHTMSMSYFHVMAYGFSFIVFTIIFRSILTGEGNTKLPMIIQGAGTLLNILLDPIFIFTLQMGVRGAAVATVASQILTFVIFVFILFFKKHAYIIFNFKNFVYSRDILNKIMKIGFPASVTMVIMSFGSMIFNRILIIFGNDAVAAYTIGHRIDHIFFMPVGSIAQSLVTLVGMFYGAKHFKLMRSIIFYGMARSVVISLVLATIFWFFAEWIMMRFTDVENIISIGKTYIRYLVFGYPLIAIGMTSSRVLQGLGKGMPILIVTILRVGAISVPLALIGIIWFDSPIEWIWISMLISFFCAPVVAIVWLLRVLRKID